MQLLILIILASGTTCFTLLGSWYAKKYGKPDLLIGLYVAFVLVAQILAVKIVLIELGRANFFVPGGVIIFSITFLLTDIVNEKFGRSETQRMILIALICQVVAALFFRISIMLPAAPFWQIQEAWDEIFGFVPRIMLASWAAFAVSENFDAYAYAYLKRLTEGKHLWTRNVFSSMPALLIDSIIFVPLAFAGTAPLLPLIKGQIAVKWLSGLVCVPFMYLNRSVLSDRPKDLNRT